MTMKYIIEVVRRRSSVTQGSALVLVNGVEVADFYDEIKLLKRANIITAKTSAAGRASRRTSRSSKECSSTPLRNSTI